MVEGRVLIEDQRAGGPEIDGPAEVGCDEAVMRHEGGRRGKIERMAQHCRAALASFGLNRKRGFGIGERIIGKCDAPPRSEPAKVRADLAFSHAGKGAALRSLRSGVDHDDGSPLA